MLAAERVLMYLYRSRDLGLRYEDSQVPLHGLTDSDWAVKLLIGLLQPCRTSVTLVATQYEKTSIFKT